MSTLRSLHGFLQILYTPAERHAQFDGVDLRRMGDLGREHGTRSWKQGPALTGGNVPLVALSLESNGIALYAHDGNRTAGGDGNRMTKSVLGGIHADDYVITLDLSCDTARQIAEGDHPLEYEPVSADLLDVFRGDRIRAAVANDAVRIAVQVLYPRIGAEAA